MPLACVSTFSIQGIDSREVTVEVDIRQGLSSFTIVGLPDRAVREARERVRAALKNSGFDYKNDNRITANMAPADVQKAGPGFDLALAVGMMLALGRIPAGAADGYALCGELSLTGSLRPVRGVLSMALGARRAGFRRLVVPPESAPEAALVEDVQVLAVPDLAHLASLLSGEWSPEPVEATQAPPGGDPDSLDLVDVRGQADAKRALEIAAAGGHNVLMIGPPGSGKTMLARRLPGLLPPASFEEAIEVTQIRSVAGLGGGGLVTERPFRAPHHTISPSGLVGGGAVPRPGEITLAHRGILFLDELPEFARNTLEALRQPLEEGRIWVTRGQRSLEFPADFMLVAAANECPCARPDGDCRCSEIDRNRYARRLSGPLLDRIDLVCHVPKAKPVELVAAAGDSTLSTSAVRERVSAARERQAFRLVAEATLTNGAMDGRMTRRHVRPDSAAVDLLLDGHRRLSLTARGHDRVLRIARTIADLEGSDAVKTVHVAEALGYRAGSATGLAA